MTIIHGEKYHRYTLDEFKTMLVQQLALRGQSGLALNMSPVYEKLFQGMDIAMLRLMCTQVKWSLARKEPDAFITAMNCYADQIILLIPHWKKAFEAIASQAQHVADCFEKASDAYKQKDSVKLNCIYQTLKTSLKFFGDECKMDKGKICERQSHLENFILSDLSPALSDKTQWTEYGLEACLSNEKFTSGTAASIHNSIIIYTFITNNVSMSIDLIDGSASMIEEMFTLDGQAKVWAAIFEVSKQLCKSLEDFSYLPPPFQA